jgi:ActR/RegA family two-component response regulator
MKQPWLKVSAIVAIVVTMASGCTAVQTVNLAVSRYCALPSDARAISREAVSVATAPNRVEIHCHE